MDEVTSWSTDGFSNLSANGNRTIALQRIGGLHGSAMRTRPLPALKTTSVIAKSVRLTMLTEQELRLMGLHRPGEVKHVRSEF
jgi:hypothetical protein